MLAAQQCQRGPVLLKPQTVPLVSKPLVIENPTSRACSPCFVFTSIAISYDTSTLYEEVSLRNSCSAEATSGRCIPAPGERVSWQNRAPQTHVYSNRQSAGSGGSAGNCRDCAPGALCRRPPQQSAQHEQ